MKTRRIEFIKPIIEAKTGNNVHFDYSRKDRGPVISEIDFQFTTKLSLRSVDVQKKVFEILFLKSRQPLAYETTTNLFNRLLSIRNTKLMHVLA